MSVRSAARPTAAGPRVYASDNNTHFSGANDDKTQQPLSTGDEKKWLIWLIWVNYAAISGHLAFALYIFIQEKDWKAPFAVEWKDWVPADPTLQCFDTNIDGTKNMCTMVDRTETLFNASIKWESGWFHLLSAIFELIAIGGIPFFYLIGIPFLYSKNRRDQYFRDAAVGKNTLRWVEYAFSASLMILIIAQVNGITSAWTQLLLFFGTATIMVTGLIGENERINNTTETNQKWTIHLLGWGLHVAIWTVIIWNFALTMTRQTSDSSDPPPAIIWMIGVIFLFFTSFGFVQLAQTRDKIKNKYKFELWYVVLSLLSKTALGFFLFTGGVMRDGHVDYIDA